MIPPYVLGARAWHILELLSQQANGAPMTLKEKLEEDIRNAMRGHQQARLDTLRFLKSQIQLTEKDNRKELDEAGVLEVVAKQAKDRRESLEMFRQGNRSDLVDKESAALAVLEEYLPAQLSREELAQLIQQVIHEVGATSSRDRGKVMGRIMPQVRGRADGAEVNALVTELMENLGQ